LIIPKAIGKAPQNLGHKTMETTTAMKRAANADFYSRRRKNGSFHHHQIMFKRLKPPLLSSPIWC
jgi:hypothetical protein